MRTQLYLFHMVGHPPPPPSWVAQVAGVLTLWCPGLANNFPSSHSGPVQTIPVAHRLGLSQHGRRTS